MRYLVFIPARSQGSEVPIQSNEFRAEFFRIFSNGSFTFSKRGLPENQIEFELIIPNTQGKQSSVEDVLRKEKVESLFKKFGAVNLVPLISKKNIQSVKYRQATA